jgi:nucleotide-binding universal stress UspA family protein
MATLIPEVLMYRCMLVPLDGTAFGEHALPYAVSIARRSGATLHLTHVHLPPIVPSGAETAVLPTAWIEVTWDEKKAYLDRLAQRLASVDSIRVETRITEGSVASALEHEAMSCAAGLIAMSTHAHVGLRRLWHHGVADQLARDLSLPILLVRPDEEDFEVDLTTEPDLGHILILLDGSPEAEAVVEHATQLGKTFGSRYTLLRVVETESVIGYSLLSPDGQLNVNPHHQAEATTARAYLEEVAAQMRSAGLEVATEVLVSAEVPGAVLDYVRSSASDPRGRIDLIAIEAHHRGPVIRLLFRGTADALLKASPVPVLLYQQPRVVGSPARMEVGMVGGT